MEYKLYYFNFRARGEVLRLIFHAAGQQFEDRRFEPREWPKYKQRAPFGTAPFLKIKHNTKSIKLGQSLTIARFLSRKFGLAGKSGLEILLTEMYADQINELLNEYITIALEKDEANKRELLSRFIEQTLVKNLDYFEEKLANSKSGFLVNSGLTWADLFLFNLLDILGDKINSVLKKYTHLRYFGYRIGTNPRLLPYLSTRPKTDI